MGFIDDQDDGLSRFDRFLIQKPLEDVEVVLVGAGRTGELKLLHDRAKQGVGCWVARVCEKYRVELLVEKLLVQQPGEARFAGAGVAKDQG